MQQEQMKLYSKAGVNPMGGCLPMVLQMPILFAMYRFFPSSIDLRQAGFLWADDLSTYDNVFDLPFNIPFYGDHVSLFTLLMTLTSFFTMKANSQMQPGMSTGPAAAAQMKMMQYFMPIMFLGIFNNFAAGLTYYYLLYNIFTYVQQKIINKYFIDEDAIHLQIQENKKKPKKKSGFQARLQKMMAEQEKGRKNQRKR